MTDWKFKDEEFKRILHRNNDPDNEEKSVINTKSELVPHLNNHKAWQGLPMDFINAVENAKTFHSMNRAFDSLYDYADDHKIWLGFMPMD